MLRQRHVYRGDAAVAVSFGVHGLAAVVEAWVAAGGSVVDPPARQPWARRWRWSATLTATSCA